MTRNPNPTPPAAARVEELARALCAVDGAGDMLGQYGSWDATPTVFQEGYQRMARAALAHMAGEREYEADVAALAFEQRDIARDALAAVERERDALRERVGVLEEAARKILRCPSRCSSCADDLDTVLNQGEALAATHQQQPAAAGGEGDG